MAIRCPGCMKRKEQSPICEHCGYNENIPNYPHQLPIGTVLREQYVIGKVLGQGGFGITYMGWDQNLDVPIAIKEYFPSGYVNRETTNTLSVTCSRENTDIFIHNRDRFIREAKALAKLRDIPGIVRIHNFFQENGTAYIVMEYVEGIDLKRYIRMQGRVMTPAETFTVLKPVMEAMSAVHEAELVHRDISPDNIMIQRNGQAKLLDFGAVREVLDADTDRQLSQATEAILKQGFAPMEQYQNRGSLGPWTDVYALCATMYYCMTGKVPPDAPARLLENRALEWDSIPGLAQSQKEALERGMALLPKQRTPSTRQLLTELYVQREQSGFRSTAQSGFQPQSKAEPALENDFRNAYAAPAAQIIPAAPTEYPSHTIPLETEFDPFSAPAPEQDRAEVIAPTAPVQREIPIPAEPVVKPPAPAAPKKKRGKLLSVIAVILAAVIGIGVFIATEDSRAYAKAEACLESGDYATALELFQALSEKDYEDSASRVLQTRYYQAKAMLDQKEYQQALAAFEDLASEGYSAAYTMIDETQYRWAIQLVQEGEYFTALAKFRSIPTYSDADYQQEIVCARIYKQGIDDYRAGLYSQAKDNFNAITGYEKADSYLDLIKIRENADDYWGRDGGGDLGGKLTAFVVNSAIDNLKKDVSFEDAADVLLISTFVASETLVGKWRTANNSHYIEFKSAEEGYTCTRNLPDFYLANATYYIEDGVFYLENDSETIKVFTFTLTSPNTLKVYAEKDGKTYTLTREG